MEKEEDDALEELRDLVEELTTSGEKTLNEEHMKSLKKICKKSDQNVALVHRLLMTQLEQDHSEIRFSAFQTIDQIFQRSHLFRKLITEDFSCLLELTVETKEEMMLPPPAKAAKALKTLALSQIEAWNTKFGKDYKRLELGFSFLKRVKKVDFAGIRSQTELQRRRQAELEAKQHQLEIRAVEKVDTEMKTMVSEIESAAMQANTCLNLLFPQLDNPGENGDLQDSADKESCSQSNSQDETENNEESLEQAGANYGFLSRAYNIRITVPLDKMRITETDDNTDVLSNLTDLMNEIKMKFLPMVSKWVNILSKSKNTKRQLEKSLSLKNRLREVSQKYGEIDIDYMKKGSSVGLADESGDEEFEDVPEDHTKGGDELISPSKTGDTQTNSALDDTPGCSKDSAEDLKRRKLLARAPVVPFDSDLKYWGQSKIHVPPIVKNDLSKFWNLADADEEFVPAGVEESLRNRSMLFPGEFQSVKWRCRAPLPNGKLCPRQDRHKCPFHGRIIARDEHGKPSNKQDEHLDEERKRKIEEQESRDIQRDIELATGADLGSTSGTKKKRQNSGNSKDKRYSRLTSLKKIENTARKRLEKKVLKSGALARVNETLDAIDAKRGVEKFGAQFNYVYER